MSRYLLFLLLISMACNERKNQQQAKVISDAKPVIISKSDLKTAIDLKQSVIEWRGTKITGKHEGTVKFERGELLFNNGKLTGGNFTVAMNTINITDIPAHEKTARRNLLNHFIDEFSIGKFSTSSFIIKHVRYLSSDQLEITGSLIIKGNTNAITIEAHQLAEDEFVSEFSFNRFDWDVGEDGSWFEKRFVDEMINLKVKLKADNNMPEHSK